MKLNKVFPRWGKTDETKVCPTCGNVKIVKKERGITRQNIKRLFHPRWTMDDIIIIFLLVMILTMAFLYKIETQQARDLVKDFNANPEKYCGVLNTSQHVVIQSPTYQIYNTTNVSLNYSYVS